MVHSLVKSQPILESPANPKIFAPASPFPSITSRLRPQITLSRFRNSRSFNTFQTPQKLTGVYPQPSHFGTGRSLPGSQRDDTNLRRPSCPPPGPNPPTPNSSSA